MKIKITEKEKTIEGKIIKGIVKPFGTSAHIPFSKQHIAKNINVIIPSDSNYSWIFSDKELNQLIIESKKLIEKEGGKLAFHKLESLERIKKSKFKIEDLSLICSILRENNKLIKLVNKIEKTIKI